MGGFHLVVEVAARDVARILDTNRVHIEVQREINNKMQRLLRVSYADLDMTRASASVEGSTVCRGIVDDIVDRICNTEIPLSLVQERDRRCSELQQELLAAQRTIAQLEASVAKAHSDVRKGESAREYLMGCYFHEVLQLRQQLQEAKVNAPTGGSVSPKGRSMWNMKRAAQHSEPHLSPAALSLQSSGQLVMPPDGTPATDSTNAVFDYTKYVSITESSFVSWPDRYAALEKEMEETIASIHADYAFQVADSERIVAQKEHTITMLTYKIRSLEELVTNMNPTVNKVIHRIAEALRAQLAKIRDRVEATNAHAMQMFEKVTHHVSCTDGRVACLAKFVQFCAQRILTMLTAVLQGQPLTIINGKPLWQYFLLSGADDPEVEAKAFWQDSDIANDIIDKFKTVLLVIEEFSSKSKRPPPVAVEIFSELISSDTFNPTTATTPLTGSGPSGGRAAVSPNAGKKIASAAKVLRKSGKGTGKGGESARSPRENALSPAPAATSGGGTSASGGSEVLRVLMQSPSPASLKKLTDTLQYMSRKCLQLIIRRVMCRIRRKVIFDHLPPFIRNIVSNVCALDRDVLQCGIELEKIRSKSTVVSAQVRILNNMLGKTKSLDKGPQDQRKASGENKPPSANAGAMSEPSSPVGAAAERRKSQVAPPSPIVAPEKRSAPLLKMPPATKTPAPPPPKLVSDTDEDVDDEPSPPPAPSRIQLQSKLSNLFCRGSRHTTKLMCPRRRCRRQFVRTLFSRCHAARKCRRCLLRHLQLVWYPPKLTRCSRQDRQNRLLLFMVLSRRAMHRTLFSRQVGPSSSEAPSCTRMQAATGRRIFKKLTKSRRRLFICLRTQLADRPRRRRTSRCQQSRRRLAGCR